LRNETEASKTRGRRREQVQRRVSVVAVSEKRMLDLAQILPINQSINQFIRQQRAEGHLQVAKYNIQ